MTDNGYGDAPLGKSVEEVQEEGGNRENSPVQGEETGPDEITALPATANANTSAAPAVLYPAHMEERGNGPDDGTTNPNRDSSEGTV
jgi:hypothetical protein